jgi:hypothetical protein
MSEFPRGWTISNYNSGTASVATITVPASPGVVHVLDSFNAKLVNSDTAAAHQTTVFVSSSDGVLAAFLLALLSTGTAVGGAPVSDESSASGLDLATGPGASMTIAFQSSAASLFQYLLVQGHDI